MGKFAALEARLDSQTPLAPEPTEAVVEVPAASRPAEVVPGGMLGLERSGHADPLARARQLVGVGDGRPADPD
eukprot:5396511-Karenia_brevis.AAC.1